jgi:hypothetical protein
MINKKPKKNTSKKLFKKMVKKKQKSTQANPSDLLLESWDRDDLIKGKPKKIERQDS